MRLGVAAIVLLLAGCAVGPDYEVPELETNDKFRAELDEGVELANVDWWGLFQDDELNRLVDIALEQNNSLAIATARIEEARAFYGFSRADLYPRIDITGAAQRANTAEQFLPGTGIQNNFALGADLSWELDLFGRIRRSNEAALAELMAAEQSRRGVYIALVADVANAYFLLRDLDARRAIAEQTLETRRDSTRIIRERFNQGTTPMLDVNQAEIQEADAAADLALYERQIQQAENLINVLLGRNPGPITRGDTLIDQPLPPAVPSGLPSELLQNRPDINEAERLLAAQTARIGVAQALRWPSLSLTGTAGYFSNEASSLFDSDNGLFAVSANIFQPLFNAGQNKARVEVEIARTEQLLNRYEFTVLQAFREVEDALVSIRTYRDESAAREMQVRAARNAAMLSRARYDGGVTSFLEVLESERSRFAAEIAASATRRARLNAFVDLYRALGGGWLPPEEEIEEE
jgi:multidrug efflux system outer membrane protein